MLVHIAHYALHMGIKAYSRCILGLSKYICPQDNGAECMQYVSMKNGTKMDNRSWKIPVTIQTISFWKSETFKLSHPILIATTEPCMPYWSRFFAALLVLTSVAQQNF